MRAQVAEDRRPPGSGKWKTVVETEPTLLCEQNPARPQGRGRVTTEPGSRGHREAQGPKHSHPPRERTVGRPQEAGAISSLDEDPRGPQTPGPVPGGDGRPPLGGLGQGRSGQRAQEWESAWRPTCPAPARGSSGDSGSGGWPQGAPRKGQLSWRVRTQEHFRTLGG